MFTILRERFRASVSVLAVVRALTAWLALTGVTSALSAETPLRLELNRLEGVPGNSCRAYLLIENTSADAYRSLKLDLFAFDTDGVVAKRLAVEAGPVPAKKTSVKLFDFAGLPCERFSRVLLNDVFACETGEGSTADCLSTLQTGSKVAGIGFVK